MNYKDIVKNKQIRFFILRCLSFIPDQLMLKIQYRIKFDRHLNLKKPFRFTEKIQWYKLNYRNELMPICVDKYKVREFVASKGLASILNEIYGVYDKPTDIDFDSLPNKFVIKTTDGSGGENVFICKDKKTLRIDKLIPQLEHWRDRKNINAGREWAYTKIEKSRFIIEQYLENDKNIDDGIEDYKFYCFYGKVKFFHIDYSRFNGHKRNFYDREGNLLDIIHTYPNFDPKYVVLDNLYTLIEIAEKLSPDFSFVRIDLYYVKKKVYFGEMTFYPGSGYESFVPDEFDFELGSWFDISQIRNV